ncbi:hypothetical protein [Streptomyces chartreusis]|uniref:hypothetical protein n=1 Tax=Streptomyces chartreusis TaxID=1969 RepID=UPI0033AB355D
MDPQQASADDVGEQERHVTRGEPLAQIARYDIQGAHRRGILRRCQYLGQSDPIPLHISLPKLGTLLPR